MSQTKLGKSPFPGKPAPAPRVKRPAVIDGVVKCRDPYVPQRKIEEHKYDAIFAGVAEGDCFQVPGDTKNLSAFSRALRCYLKRQGNEGIVRQESRTADGIPRVWLLKILKGKV